jgi:serine/threonine protein kinase
MTSGGQQFGKYHILAELVAGGFATVYKAMDTTLERGVALKILHPPLLTDRRFVQNFRLEAKTLAALRHPQIITVYEVGERHGAVFAIRWCAEQNTATNPGGLPAPGRPGVRCPGLRAAR